MRAGAGGVLKMLQSGRAFEEEGCEDRMRQVGFLTIPVRPG